MEAVASGATPSHGLGWETENQGDGDSLLWQMETSSERKESLVCLGPSITGLCGPRLRPDARGWALAAFRQSGCQKEHLNTDFTRLDLSPFFPFSALCVVLSPQLSRGELLLFPSASC